MDPTSLVIDPVGINAAVVPKPAIVDGEHQVSDADDPGLISFRSERKIGESTSRASTCQE